MITRTFTITLAMPSSTPPNEPNGFQRLRRLLKCLVRSYGLRCIYITEQGKASTSSDDNDKEGAQ